MNKSISDIISNLSDDYRDSSLIAKIGLFICAAFIFIFLIKFLFWKHSSAPPKLGLYPLRIVDENKDEWILYLVKGQPTSSLKSGTKPGPPLLVRTELQPKEDQILIGLIVEGRAKERYIGGAVKNGQWQPAPSFKVVDEAGKVLTSGKFEYG